MQHIIQFMFTGYKQRITTGDVSMVSKYGTRKLLELKQIDAVSEILQTILAKVPKLRKFELICYPNNKN